MLFKKSVVLVFLAIIGISLLTVTLEHSFTNRQNALAPKIAVIYVEGVIVGGHGQGGLMGSGGTDRLIRQLHEVQQDPTVKAVVLRINSPGGSATASQEVGEELKKLRASHKIVVTSMGDMAASGGYWLAACTDKIYANPSTLTGSIGVYMPYTNWEDLSKKLGISQDKIKSGPHKDIMSPDRPMTPEERAMLQKIVDELYGQFVAVVAEGRHMDAAKVRTLADGRVYTGSQAKAAGLVDELGDMYDAIDGAAAMAGIQGTPDVKEFDKPTTWGMLFGSDAKLDLSQLSQMDWRMLLSSGKNTPLLTAPMAMPEKWQVE